MKKILVLIFGILILTTCKKKVENTDCFKEDPFEIDWLNNIRQVMINDTVVSDFGTPYIKMYTYKGNKVFEIYSCLGCSDQMTIILNCKNEEICTFGGIGGLNTCPDFYETYTDEEVIYSE